MVFDKTMLPICGVRWHTFNNWQDAEAFIRWIKTNYGKKYNVTSTKDETLGYEVRVTNW